ncbi:MAG TPA: hypothetical protein VER33_28485 [Polyangiaceae bacterium]|nr:hypothetical protein [Polyangiaceae bacterium]
MQSGIKKYARYLLIRPRGAFTYSVQSDAAARSWRSDAIRAITYIRSLGLTSPIEIGTTG